MFNKLYGFVCPIKDNAGNDTAANLGLFRSHLLATVGGYSERAISGAWKDQATGEVYHDKSIVVETACSAEDAEKLTALWFVLFPDQLALAVYHSGGLDILDAPTANRLGSKLAAVKVETSGAVAGVSIQHAQAFAPSHEPTGSDNLPPDPLGAEKNRRNLIATGVVGAGRDAIRQAIKALTKDAYALIDRATVATEGVEKAQWALESALSGYFKATAGYRSSPKTGDGTPCVKEAVQEIVEARDALEQALKELHGE